MKDFSKVLFFFCFILSTVVVLVQIFLVTSVLSKPLETSVRFAIYPWIIHPRLNFTTNFVCILLHCFDVCVCQ